MVFNIEYTTVCQIEEHVSRWIAFTKYALNVIHNSIFSINNSFYKSTELTYQSVLSIQNTYHPHYGGQNYIQLAKHKIKTVKLSPLIHSIVHYLFKQASCAYEHMIQLPRRGGGKPRRVQAGGCRMRARGKGTLTGPGESALEVAGSPHWAGVLVAVPDLSYILSPLLRSYSIQAKANGYRSKEVKRLYRSFLRNPWSNLNRGRGSHLPQENHQISYISQLSVDSGRRVRDRSPETAAAGRRSRRSRWEEGGDGVVGMIQVRCLFEVAQVRREGLFFFFFERVRREGLCWSLRRAPWR